MYFDKEANLHIDGWANVMLVVLCKYRYCISLNISRLQSDACDLTERAAFLIGSGSQVLQFNSIYYDSERLYSYLIIWFSSGSLLAILKNKVWVRQK